MKRKSTNVDLVEDLTKINSSGRLDGIIKAAEQNQYHDFKSVHSMPKVVLIDDLSHFPETIEITNSVMRGEYDESPDEQDREEMRRDLKEGGATDEFIKTILG
ncbi:MAG: hypothetical protein V4721_16490 [Bacteroidota bacterium]